MAQLTETLGSVNSGKPIVNPGPADPSFLGAVADFAAGAIPGVVGIGRERDRRSEQARADANDAALDNLVGGVHDIRRQSAEEALRPEAPMPDWIGAIDNNTMLPGGVMSQANEILRVKRAVEQGRVSAGTLDMRIENLVTTLYQQHPESRYEIAVAMKGLGIDHYLFREETTRRAAEESGEAASLATERTQIDYAASRGLVTRDTPPADAARIGRLAMAEAARAQAAQAQAEADRANRQLTETERAARARETAGEVRGSLIGQAAIAIAPLMDATSLALSGAGTDAERQTVIADFRVQTRAALNAYKVRGIGQIAAANGTDDDIKAFSDFIDNQITSIDAIYNTSFEQNRATASNLAAALNIDMARALPIYSRISAAIGPAAASAIVTGLDGVPGLDPRMIEAAKAELINFDPTSPRGIMNLARAIGFLRGEVGLQDLSREEAAVYLRTNSAALLANQAAVLRGDASALEAWRPTYANTVEAVVETAPSVASIESMSRATQMFATPAARQVLDQAIRQDPEYGQALVQGSRAAAAHALQIVRNSPATEGSLYGVRYNPNLARFEATLSREQYEARRAASRGTSQVWNDQLGTYIDVPTREMPTYEEARRRIPQDINQRLTALNNSLVHLTETDKYDEAIPSSLSVRERRAMYATGATPDSLRGPTGDAPTAAGEWERIRSNLSTQIQGLLTETVRSPVATMPDFRSGLIQSESGGDPTEVNSEGYGGRMQFGAERLADAAVAGLVPEGTTGAQFAQMPVEQQQRVEDWHFNNIDTRARQEGLTAYHGQVVGGVPINENSIRAMAHLGGFEGAKRFIETNGRYNPADSNGTRLSDYGRRFGGTQ